MLVLASALSLTSVIPYILGILKGKVKPNIVSWITWMLLTGLATSAELAAHEYRTAIFTGVCTLAVVAVVLLGLFYGYVKYTRFDYICQLSTLVGLALWWLFNSPAAGIIAAVAIDFIGAMPTFRHAWNQPGEENALTFGISACSAVFSVLALTSFNVSSLSYPIYLVFANLAIMVTILYRKATHKNYKASKTVRIN